MRRAIALAAIMMVAGALLPPGGAVGSPVQYPELAGMTQVVGRATASTMITLPRPVVVKANALDETIVRVSATGPIAGLVLRQDSRRPAQLTALSIDPCSSPPCTQPRAAWSNVSVPGSHGRKAMTLPAGRYFLYFIAEGGPAEVTLRLEGLGGESTVRPLGKTRAEFGELDAGVAGGPVGPVYRAATTFELPRFGLRLAAVELDTAPHLIGRYSSCLREAVAPVPDATRAFTCPGISGWLIVTPQARDARVRFATLSTLGGGSYEQTMAVETAAVPEEVSSFGFSLSYDGRDTGDRYFSEGIGYEQRP